MTELFVAVSLDEEVDVLVADQVRAPGFAAAMAMEAGNRGASDAAQLKDAAGRAWRS